MAANDAGTMRFVTCECGFYAESSDPDQLVDQGQRHARTEHGMELSAEQLRGLIVAKGAPE